MQELAIGVDTGPQEVDSEQDQRERTCAAFAQQRIADDGQHRTDPGGEIAEQRRFCARAARRRPARRASAMSSSAACGARPSNSRRSRAPPPRTGCRTAPRARAPAVPSIAWRSRPSRGTPAAAAETRSGTPAPSPAAPRTAPPQPWQQSGSPQPDGRGGARGFRQGRVPGAAGGGGVDGNALGGAPAGAPVGGGGRVQCLRLGAGRCGRAWRRARVRSRAADSGRSASARALPPSFPAAAA